MNNQERVYKYQVQKMIDQFNKEDEDHQFTNLRRETHYLKGNLVWVVDYYNGRGTQIAIIGYSLREAAEHMEWKLSGMANDYGSDKSHTTNAGAKRYKTHRDSVECRQLKSQLDRIIADKLAESENQNDSATIHFNFDGKVWCLSGETIGGLVWETDDFEADNKTSAIRAAIDYLIFD